MAPPRAQAADDCGETPAFSRAQIFYTKCAFLAGAMSRITADLRPVRVLIRISIAAAFASLTFIIFPAFTIAGKPGHAKTAAVAGSPTVRLANLSTRLPVGSGDNVLIAGFTISGSQPKKVIVRGLGPLLPVNGNLADPTLGLHNSSGAMIASNDNWRDTQQEELIATIPPANDYDSAIVRNLTPGAYTAVLAGKGATTGVGLVEVYDLDGAESRLVNIATRGRVGEGDDVLICGTIAVGNGITTILFRALGPSTGVPGALNDPTLALHDGQGAIIATNDDWQDTQAAAIQSTSLAPNNPSEAAILRDVTPGAYTAVVRGKNGTTGVAVIDAYQIN